MESNHDNKLASNQEILEDNLDESKVINAEIQNAVLKAVTHAFEYNFSGPLPPPHVIEGYEKAYPGFANKILSAFESDVLHRQEQSKLRLQASIETTRRGQRDGFIFGIVGLFAGLIIVALGLFLGTTASAIATSISGTALSGLSIFRLVSKFIDGPNVKTTQNKKNDIKNDQ